VKWKKIDDLKYRFYVEIERNSKGKRMRQTKNFKFDHQPTRKELLATAAEFERTARAANQEKELKPDGELDTARGE
jgi:hypothetical protein